MTDSLAARLDAHGLGHLTLRDLAKIEEAFGVELVAVTEEPRPTAPALPVVGPYGEGDYIYAYLA